MHDRADRRTLAGALLAGARVAGARLVIVCLALACLSGLVSATTQASSPSPRTGETGATRELRERLGAPASRAGDAAERLPALEAAIDPAEHHLAPGDELALGLWGSIDAIVPLVVTADGRLVVPTVGVIAVDGLTLAQAQERMTEACRPAYPGARISLSLVRPGLLRIPITGQVREPGTYEIPSTFRLADLIALAGGLREGADARSIRISRGESSPIACDLLAWRVLGDPGDNPVLRTGDRVQVPTASAHYRVRGLFPDAKDAVRSAAGPVDRPFLAETRLVAACPGDTLGLVLAAAGWLGAQGRDDGVWIERRGEERRWVPAEEGGEPLRAGDVIDIPFAREWVSVNGAVQRPGFYPFLPGQTVADYVGLAGGPNQYGRSGGWKVHGPAGERLNLEATDPVAAGARIWVPERQWYKVWTILTPLGTAAAVVVSLAALLSRQ